MAYFLVFLSCLVFSIYRHWLAELCTETRKESNASSSSNIRTVRTPRCVCYLFDFCIVGILGSQVSVVMIQLLNGDG